MIRDEIAFADLLECVSRFVVEVAAPDLANDKAMPSELKPTDTTDETPRQRNYLARYEMPAPISGAAASSSATHSSRPEANSTTC